MPLVALVIKVSLTAGPAVCIRRPTNLVCLVTYMSITETVSSYTHKQQDKRGGGGGGGGGGGEGGACVC